MPGMRAVGLWRRWMRRTSQVAVLMWHYVSFTSSGLTIFTLGPNFCNTIGLDPARKSALSVERFAKTQCRRGYWAFEHSGLNFDQRLGFCLRSQHRASVFLSHTR